MDGNINSNSDFSDCVEEVVVLAFEFTNIEAEKIVKQFSFAIKNADVNAAIQNSMISWLRTKTATNSTVVSLDEIKKLTINTGTEVGKITSKSVKEKIEKLPEFLRLKDSFKNLKTSYLNNTKSGIFIDKNKNTIYVVGSAIVISGIGVLFLTKNGKQKVFDAITLLKDKEIVIPIGKFELKSELLAFNPDARNFGEKIGLKANLEHVKLDFSFGMVAEAGQVQQYKGNAIVKSDTFSLEAIAEYKPVKHDYFYSLKFGTSRKHGKNTFNISVAAIYKPNEFSANLNTQATLKGGATISLDNNISTNKNGKWEYGAMFKVSIPLNFK